MKNYQKDDLTIHWDLDKCAHSGICVKSLSNVFKPKEKPWIDVDGATKEEIMTAIDKCPSGALSYSVEGVAEENDVPEVSVTIIHNGPARVKGKVAFINKDGEEEIKDGQFSICRCGKTEKSPFCDGSHKNLMPKLDE